MQINKIRAIVPRFTSSKKTYRFGYDDSISQERRDFLREDIFNNSIPYYNILENSGRLEKYQLEKLIGALYGQKINQDSLQNMLQKIRQHPQRSITEPVTETKKTSLDHKLIEDLPLWNLELVSEELGVYRGQSLQGAWGVLKTIQKAGIERIVDLAGYENLEDNCKDLELEYLHYPITPHLFFINNPMLQSEEENQQKFFNQSRLFGYKNQQQQAYRKKMMDVWHKNKNAEIDKFIKFIRFMQKGKLYIACEWGTYTTDNALMLNSFFNPLYVRTPDYITTNNRIYLQRVQKLYQNFTAEHKELMGWTKEFDKNTVDRLKKIPKII